VESSCKKQKTKERGGGEKNPPSTEKPATAKVLCFQQERGKKVSQITIRYCYAVSVVNTLFYNSIKEHLIVYPSLHTRILHIAQVFRNYLTRKWVVLLAFVIGSASLVKINVIV
jgi:hypothetical protein